MLFKKCFLSFLVCLVFQSMGAKAEITNCTQITSVPYAITTPGIYCLKSSFTISDAYATAISIQSDDVVLDLNGFVLDASATGVTSNAFGISSSEKKNISVRNGVLRGFYTGINITARDATSVRNNLVENMLIDSATVTGIAVVGKGTTVRNNRVINTGGSTLTNTVTGIKVSGDGVYVLDNKIINTFEGASGYAMGIAVDKGVAAHIERNLVSNNAFGVRSSYGIRTLSTSTQSEVDSNHIANFRTGIACTSTTLYKDNTVGGATTAFSGGVAAGTTNYSF